MWQYNQTPSSDELYHFGVKGMKWGRRRYQNANGTLTPAGRKRYGLVSRAHESLKNKYSLDGDDSTDSYEAYKQRKKDNSLGAKAHVKLKNKYPLDGDDPTDSYESYKQRKKDNSIVKKTHNKLKDKYKLNDDPEAELREVEGDPSKYTKKKGLSDRQKKAVKVGVAVAGTALATYGAYKASQYVKEKAGHRSYERGMQQVNKWREKANSVDWKNNPNAADDFDMAYGMMRERARNTDARTDKVRNSTVEAAKYLYQTRKRR